MTEEGYISELWSRWPHDHEDEVTLETLALAEQAVCEFPLSAKLHVMRGDLILLGPESSPHSLEDALISYQKAVEIDPEFEEAWEEIGYYYDVVMDDEVAAQPYFQQAEELRTRTEKK